MTEKEKYVPKKGDYVSLGGVFSGIAQEDTSAKTVKKNTKKFSGKERLSTWFI